MNRPHPQPCSLGYCVHRSRLGSINPGLPALIPPAKGGNSGPPPLQGGVREGKPCVETLQMTCVYTVGSLGEKEA